MSIVDRRGVSVDATDTAIAGDPNPGLAIKAPVRVATTAAITLSGLQTIDGIALADGDRVLVKDQADQRTNGIYNASSGLWQRTIDATSNDQWTSGTQVIVTSGTANIGGLFRLTTADPVTIGTSNLTFTDSISAALLPTPTATTLGGVKSLAAVTHQFLTSIGTDGLPVAAQPAFADISGTLTAAQEPSTTVNAVSNDTNVTGSISAQALTLGWTGTLAAARLNPNVVQNVVNDTNITGSISAQTLTLGWTGTLGNSRLTNSSITISGHALSLGGALSLAQADISGLTTADSPTFAKLNLGPAAANSGVTVTVTGSGSTATFVGTNSTNGRTATVGNIDGFNCGFIASVGDILFKLGSTTWLDIGNSGTTNRFTTGDVQIDNTTDSSSASTGSLHTAGGIGAAKAILVGTNLWHPTVANGSVATALSSVGPTGAHTSVQEWFPIKNASGTTRYVPGF